MNFFEELENYDSEVAAACKDELSRQQHNIELIASENIVSKAVLLAAGGILTNKYAEGYPDHRYYGGCKYIDVVEEIARERAKKLFGAEHANVQPHCGASANLAVFFQTFIVFEQFFITLLFRRLVMSSAGCKGIRLYAGKFTVSGKQQFHILYCILFPGFKFYPMVKQNLVIDPMNQICDLSVYLLPILQTGSLPDPCIPIGICLDFCPVDIYMGGIHTLFLENIFVDILKDFLYAALELVADEIAECHEARCFHIISQPYVTNVRFAELFQFSQRRISAFHKSEQNDFQ